jgi:hypothetical protein
VDNFRNGPLCMSDQRCVQGAVVGFVRSNPNKETDNQVSDCAENESFKNMSHNQIFLRTRNATSKTARAMNAAAQDEIPSFHCGALTNDPTVDP